MQLLNMIKILPYEKSLIFSIWYISLLCNQSLNTAVQTFFKFVFIPSQRFFRNNDSFPNSHTEGNMKCPKNMWKMILSCGSIWAFLGISRYPPYFTNKFLVFCKLRDGVHMTLLFVRIYDAVSCQFPVHPCPVLISVCCSDFSRQVTIS